MKPLKEGLVTFYFYLKKDGTAKIDYLGMSKRYQGQGRGTQIVLEFIEFCKSKGINKILIDAHMDAVIFWKKMGFKIDRKRQIINGYRQDYHDGEFIIKEANNVENSRKFNRKIKTTNQYS